MSHGVGLAVLASTIACAKVDNPFYVDELADEASDSAGSTDSSSSDSSDSSSTTDSTGDSESTSDSDSAGSTDSTDSSADTDCPPSESGCPCAGGTCSPGLTCIDGICLGLQDCAIEDPDVHVEWAYDNLGMPADTTCTVTATKPGTGLALTIGACDDALTSLTITLDPLPPGLMPIVGLVDAPVGVHLFYEQGGLFVRLAMPGYDLWLVDGPLVASGNPVVSDYPGEVVALVGECPGEPKFCGNEVGELQRRGVRIVGQPIFDGSMLIDTSMVGWVDVARVDCMVPAYRFAIVDWP